MSQIKSRNWTKQEDEDLLAILQGLKSNEAEATWNEIAELMKQRNPSSRKTGKQCRERWANQLDPKIKRNENWSKEENQTLFRLHIQVGNKWSQISSHIPGRTDNCVKNHFYSTMRRGLRKINSYIQNVKRKQMLAKTFKNQILNKILTLCEGKNDNKFQFNTKAKEMALQIKNNLIKLSLELSDIDEDNIQFKEQIFQEILEFSRNCRKRKCKKSNDVFSQIENQEQEEVQGIEELEQRQNNRDQIILNQSIKNKEKEKGKKYHIEKNKEYNENQTQISSNKMIKIPLCQITVPKENQEVQEHQKKNLENEGKQILQTVSMTQNLEEACRFNPFPFIISTGTGIPGFFNFYQSGSQINQQWIRSSIQKEKKSSEGPESMPDLSKNIIIEGKQKKNQSRIIDFSNFTPLSQTEGTETNKQKVNSLFPQLIKSQDLDQNMNFPFSFQNKQSPFASMGKINPITQSSDLGLGLTFSPSFSPFSLYGASQGFSYYIGNWPTQQQKFKSTRYQSQQYEQKQKQPKTNQPLLKKSSLKLSKRQSIQDINIPISQQKNE